MAKRIEPRFKRRWGLKMIEGCEPGFTRRWFLRRNLAAFREHVVPAWAGKPIVYLEIGVFEGMSLVWMLQNVLTHPESRAVGIDPWLMTTKLSEDAMEEVMRRAVRNLDPWIRPLNSSETLLKCEPVRGNSCEVLRRMRGRGGFAGIGPGTVDLCMIDGGHYEPIVLDDAWNCLPLLKVGGWLMFDDVENARPKVGHVADGLRRFVEEAGDRVELAWKSTRMECHRKVG